MIFAKCSANERYLRKKCSDFLFCCVFLACSSASFRHFLVPEFRPVLLFRFHEPFGYGIFEAVDYGKIPIIHTNWCEDLEYPYRASSKKQFKDIYIRLSKTSYEEKEKWFNKIKSFMIERFSDKEEWKKQLLNIYNI